ncbi:MAG: hypothetical protein Q4A81_06940 [Pasteurellaceae bacterium]|nr:hypothetical protein [Pasteurellaceae bacterium]
MYLLHLTDEQGHFELIDADFKEWYGIAEEALIELSNEQYQQYLTITSEEITFKNGVFVGRANQPSPVHIWNGSEWVISPEKQTTYLTERKDSLLTTLANRADQLKNGLLVGYPQTEIESFYRQEKEALAWQLDHTTDTPMLPQIARLRDVPFEVLVEKVIEKSAQFAVAIGIIIGQRQKFEGRLLTAADIEQLNELEKEIEEWQFQVN